MPDVCNRLIISVLAAMESHAAGKLCKTPPFSTWKAAFCMLKSGLLHAKMQPFTSAQTINVRFVEKFLLLSIFIITFVSLYMFKPDNGRKSCWRTFSERRLLCWRFVLDPFGIWQFQFSSKTQSNGRCLCWCGISIPWVDSHYCMVAYLYGVYISAWASALLVLTRRAMPEPQVVGRAGKWVPTLFSFMCFL